MQVHLGDLVHCWRAFRGIVKREYLRLIHQRTRFLASLVRPLIWLIIFAVGFRSILGVSITPPYETYITYDEYILPGLIGMIQLFNGMQSALSMVYDREMGSMRVLLSTPLPRWFLLISRLTASVVISLLLVYAFLLSAFLFGTRIPLIGYITVIPSLLLSGAMLGALGILLSSKIEQMENFAGVMNFVIFPLLFASSALYPLWRVRESSVVLYYLCQLNPFTHAVELIRYSMYARVNSESLMVVSICTILFLTVAISSYSPTRWFKSYRR